MAQSALSTAQHYLATRITSLRPPLTRIRNPISPLGLLNRQQWMFFLVAFLSWTWDAFDFFTVSLTLHQLSKEFDRSIADLTWGITVVLMLRSVGAIGFGLASDRYGRKWPFIFNNFLFVVLELGAGFCKTYEEFIAARALFGIAMGGIYGNAAATALEDCPLEARGMISGLLQQGYSFGYLLATVFALALVDTTPHGWRPLFWFGAIPPVFIMVFRYYLPETQTYLRQQAKKEAAKAARMVDPVTGEKIDAPKESAAKEFLREGGVAIRQHWLLLVYLVLMMAGFNLVSHGTQDMYPIFLRSEAKFTPRQITVIQVFANMGAFISAVTASMSQSLGRRLTMLVSLAAGAILLYPYSAVLGGASAADRTARTTVTAFFQQFFAQGAWGVVPVHLMELSPAAIRTFAVGTAYQLGNLASSPSSTVQATLAERFPLPDDPATGEKRYRYGFVIGIFCAVVYSYLLVMLLLGPEKLNRDMEEDIGGATTESDEEEPEKARAAADNHSTTSDKPHRSDLDLLERGLMVASPHSSAKGTPAASAAPSVIAHDQHA